MRADAEGAVPAAPAGSSGHGGEPDPVAGLDRSVPHTSTLSLRQQSLKVAIPQRALGGPLHLVIDSIGLEVLGGMSGRTGPTSAGSAGAAAPRGADWHHPR